MVATERCGLLPSEVTVGLLLGTEGGQDEQTQHGQQLVLYGLQA